MQNYNEQLPFGKIQKENVANNPEDPLRYAEAHFEGGGLQWEGKKSSFDKMPENFMLQLKNYSDGDTVRIGINEIMARYILHLHSGYWDYAE